MLVARILFFFIFLTIPYYLLPSGGIQISSAFVLLTAIAVGVFGWTEVVFGPAIVRHLLFLLYGVGVNAVWALMTDNTVFLLYATYLVVAGVVFFCATMVGRAMRRRDAQLLILLLFLSVLAQAAIVLLGVGKESPRPVAFFNNPNQLAYYVAGCAGLSLVVSHLYRVQSLLVPAIALVALAVAGLTVSRAGVAACLLFVLLNVFSSKALTGMRRVFVIALICIGVFAGYERFMRSPTYEALTERVESVESVDQSADQRGYDRILNYPDNLVWGVGEGAFERFDEDIELHSYPGTLLFSYGVIGVVLFLWFLIAAVPDRWCLLYLMPMLVYNLTHNGGRSLMLWAMLGLMAAATLPSLGNGDIVVNKQRRRRRKSSRSSGSRSHRSRLGASS